MLAKILLRALLATVTPKTAAALNHLLLDMLEDFAIKTKTDLDDKVFELFKRFLATTEEDPKEK